MSFQIAIDGPAGAGKSTIAKLVAEKLHFLYIDTGAMYRAMGYYFLSNGVDYHDEEAVCAGIGGAAVDLEMIDGVQHVLLNGEDVNGVIRTGEVGMAASKVSTYGPVRKKLVASQQAIAGEKNVVMDGRDIGTVVLPDAPLKIYLTASVEKRAQRRLLDMELLGEEADLETIKKDIEARDHQDKTRAESPLRQAEDAVYLDSSDLTIEEVTEKILTLAEERGAGAAE